MRLVVTTPFLETRGGMERVVLKIAQHFKARIHCISYDAENTFQEFADLEIETAKPGMLRSLPLGRRVSGAMDAGWHFHNTKLADYDVINAHQTPSEWIRNKNAPVIWYCLLDDTPVLRRRNGSFGYRQIKDLEAGDELFGFNAKAHTEIAKVIRMRNKKARNLCLLRLNNGREIAATADHRFFIRRGGKLVIARLSDIKPGDLVPVPCRIRPASLTRKALDVKHLMQAAYGSHPYWSARLFTDFGGKSIAVGHRKTVAMPAKLAISKELMRLLGYYAAEGYIYFRHNEGREDLQVGFSFGIKEEKTLVADCARCIEAVFGMKPRIRKVERRSEIIITLPNVFALFMLALQCGSKAKEKRVPDIVFNAGRLLQDEYLKAYVSGDGHFEKKANRWACTSVGRHLMTGLLYLLAMTGKQGGLVRRFSNKFSDYDAKLAHQIYGLRFSEKGYSRYESEGELLFVPVRDIKPLPGEHNVVDIEVTGNHSFLAGDCIFTHNCHTPNREAFDLYEWRQKRRNALSRLVFWSSIQPFKFLESRTVPKIEHIFTNSRNSQERITKYLRRSSEVLHPGVEADKFTSKSFDRYFLYPSRIAPEKELEYAIEAFKLFANRQNPKAGSGKTDSQNWKLIITGALSKRPEHTAYLKKIQSMSGPDIEIKTNVGDWELRDLYARCSAVLYTPVNEDYGLVPLEAMASGKPCIARNEGGPKETVVNGRDGFLVDSIWDMAGKMELLAKDPERCAQMGKEGRAKVERDFTWGVFLKRFGDKAEELAKKGSGR